MSDAIMQWITGDKTGISSETIWAHFVTHSRPHWPSPPSDPSDFLRCYWLLKLAPEWKGKMRELGLRYPESAWPKLAENWDELTAMLEDAWPKSCSTGDYCDEPPATAMYKRMKALRKELAPR